MDKLSMISGTLFTAAGMFAVTSLALPDWIVTEVSVARSLGGFFAVFEPTFIAIKISPLYPFVFLF
jgi:hypothetical protein